MGISLNGEHDWCGGDGARERVHQRDVMACCRQIQIKVAKRMACLQRGLALCFDNADGIDCFECRFFFRFIAVHFSSVLRSTRNVCGVISSSLIVVTPLPM